MHAASVHTVENLLYFTLLQLIVSVGAAWLFGRLASTIAHVVPATRDA